jgi:hypothetical protein
VNGTTKFDQVVTFTTGQVFPGTIAGVTAGADLTGGGTGGQVTLNLDTTKVPTLAAGSNTFAGVGSFNRVGIGTTSPVGALQVTDTSQLGTIIGDLNPFICPEACTFKERMTAE